MYGKKRAILTAVIVGVCAGFGDYLSYRNGWNAGKFVASELVPSREDAAESVTSPNADTDED
jgi:hypothetical protein